FWTDHYQSRDKYSSDREYWQAALNHSRASVEFIDRLNRNARVDVVTAGKEPEHPPLGATQRGQATTMPDINAQRRRRLDVLVRAYKTYWLFGNRRREKLGLKMITFLGIVVPLVSGGLIQTMYVGTTPPAWLLLGSGLVGLALTALSLWAVVDRWD